MIRQRTTGQFESSVSDAASGQWLRRSKFALAASAALAFTASTGWAAGITLTTLHSFQGTDGGGPKAGLVQAGDGSLRFLVAAHLNEGKAARYPGVAIGNDFNTQHRPERLECRS